MEVTEEREPFAHTRMGGKMECGWVGRDAVCLALRFPPLILGERREFGREA